MGIVRRCGRPPRPAPPVHKPTRDRLPVCVAGGVVELVRRDSRELAAAVARVLPIAAGLDRRVPPRIPALPGEPQIDRREPHADSDAVICSCRDHVHAGPVTAAR